MIRAPQVRLPEGRASLRDIAVAISAAALAAFISGWARPAVAESALPPPRCLSTVELRPSSGATIPANTPALGFKLPMFATGSQTPPIEDFDIRIRAIGATEDVPLTVEREMDGSYLLRFKHQLAPGDYAVGFRDLCAGTSYEPPVDPMTATRDEHNGFHVVAALPPPTVFGPATIESITYDTLTDLCARVSFARMVIAVPLAGFAGYRSVVSFPVTTSQGFAVSVTPVMSPDGSRLTLSLTVGCDVGRPGIDLDGPSDTLEIRAKLLGAAVPFASTRVPIALDCSQRQLVNICDADGSAPDGSASDGAVADTAWSPDLLAIDDYRFVPPAPADAKIADAGLAPEPADAAAPGHLASSGCGCRIGTGPARGPSLLIAVTVAWARRRRRVACRR
jgi:hypothetical protein